MKTGLMIITEVKKEIEYQLKRMKLNPIENSNPKFNVSYIADYNTASMPWFVKHLKMTFIIDSNGWIVGTGILKTGPYEETEVEITFGNA